MSSKRHIVAVVEAKLRALVGKMNSVEPKDLACPATGLKVPGTEMLEHSDACEAAIKIQPVDGQHTIRFFSVFAASVYEGLRLPISSELLIVRAYSLEQAEKLGEERLGTNVICSERSPGTATEG